MKIRSWSLMVERDDGCGKIFKENWTCDVCFDYPLLAEKIEEFLDAEELYENILEAKCEAYAVLAERKVEK